ncbi:FecR family protein [Acinetobacter populi]|uniref:Histidine kinase n=1 Tax=Acinetobacter populi TaxID=1582270 RepID=A0A1Z9YX53_9GAMM|nr:FecR domain-containing protein [Acinetobacter populi]OUY06773.1 hypothetical protein CAP51_12685 [Acinetobacter populi]
MSNSSKDKIDPALIAQAAEWLIEIHANTLSEAQQQQFEQWKNQSPQHQQAWQHAQQLQQYLSALPEEMSEKIFDEKPHQQLLNKFLWIFAVSATLAATAYYGQQQAWLADYRTAYGTQKNILLEDGTRIMLNSKTAIDIDYTATKRTIKLHYGEIFIQTGKDITTPKRPFWVLSSHGSIQALGTQFNVEQQQQQTSVAVIEHATRIENNAGQIYQLDAGKQTQFTSEYINQPQPFNTLHLAWHHHLIVANRMPLSEFTQQIEKNYGIKVNIHHGLEPLLISGTYPSNDLQSLFNSLAQAYNLKIEQSAFSREIMIKQND